MRQAFVQNLLQSSCPQPVKLPPIRTPSLSMPRFALGCWGCRLAPQVPIWDLVPMVRAQAGAATRRGGRAASLRSRQKRESERIPDTTERTPVETGTATGYRSMLEGAGGSASSKRPNGNFRTIRAFSRDPE